MTDIEEVEEGAPPPPPTFWFDIETTGLDLHTGHVLELGFAWGDVERNYVLGGDRDALWLMADLSVRAMHEESGLWAAIEPDGPTLAEVEEEILDMFGPFTDGIIPGGSGVERFDMAWMKVHAPYLFSRFTYYAYDVGSVRRLFLSVGVEPPPDPEGLTRHRALDDALIARHQWEFYRGLVT